MTIKQDNADEQFKTRNHRFIQAGDWEFKSEPMTDKQIEKLRKEAEQLLKDLGEKKLIWRSCWQCNGAHTHFLNGRWGKWVLNCMECGKYYYKKTDITDYTQKN